MNAQEVAALAQTQGAAAPAHSDRDPLAAYTLLSQEEPVEGGHGTVAFAQRKSTGVHVLVYVPASRKRAQSIPVTGILSAGFVPAPEEAPEPEPTPEPEKPKTTSRKRKPASK